MNNIVMSVIFAVAGISCFAYFQTLSRFLATFFAQRFHEAYGQEATEKGWDNPDSTINKYYYRAAIAFIGIFLLVMSLHALLGPITL